MTDILALGRQTRRNFLELVNELDVEALTRIPNGFRNSILWNFGHSVVTQELLIYGLSALPMHLPPQIIDSFRKGSIPDGQVEPETIKILKAHAELAHDMLEADLAKGLFNGFKEYPTSFGILLTDLEDAIRFCAVHEALHLGYAMAQRKGV